MAKRGLDERLPEGYWDHVAPAFGQTTRGLGDTMVGNIGTIASLLGLDSPTWEAARDARGQARKDAYARDTYSGVAQDTGGALFPILAAALGLQAMPGTWAGAGAGVGKVATGAAGTPTKALLTGLGLAGAGSAVHSRRKGHKRAAEGLPSGADQERIQQEVAKVLGGLGLAIDPETGQLMGAGAPAQGAGLEADPREISPAVMDLLRLAASNEQPQGQDVGWGYHRTGQGIVPRTASDMIMRAPMSQSRNQRERQQRFDADMASQHYGRTLSTLGQAATADAQGLVGDQDRRMQRVESQMAQLPLRLEGEKLRAQGGVDRSVMAGLTKIYTDPNLVDPREKEAMARQLIGQFQQHQGQGLYAQHPGAQYMR